MVKKGLFGCVNLAKNEKISHMEAETVALRAAGFVLGDGAMADRFLQETGLEPGVLRQRLHDEDALAALLDFVLSDDALVVGCAAELGLPPDRIAAARQMLVGGQTPDWT